MTLERQPRMIISTEGPPKSGKTRFALTAPRPLTYLDFDYGAEGVEHAGIDEHKQYDLLAAEWMPDVQAKRHAQEVMRRFVADFRAALEQRVRSLVVDTFTAAWAGQRLARAEDRYVEMEEEFKSLIRTAYVSPHTNVILIHHMRPDWKKDSTGKSYKAGTESRDGMDGIGNMVQLAIRQRYVAPQVAGGMRIADGRFEADVLWCRDNIGLMGTTLPGMDFATLCGAVVPAIDWSK